MKKTSVRNDEEMLMLGLDGAKEIYDTRGGKCPSCGFHIKVGVIQCEHCKHQLTESELQEIEVCANKTFKKSSIFGVVFFMAVLVLFSIVFSGK